jgi:hypothetical protein
MDHSFLPIEWCENCCLEAASFTEKESRVSPALIWGKCKFCVGNHIYLGVSFLPVGAALMLDSINRKK